MTHLFTTEHTENGNGINTGNSFTTEHTEHTEKGGTEPSPCPLPPRRERVITFPRSAGEGWMRVEYLQKSITGNSRKIHWGTSGRAQTLRVLRVLRGERCTRFVIGAGEGACATILPQAEACGYHGNGENCTITGISQTLRVLRVLRGERCTRFVIGAGEGACATILPQAEACGYHGNGKNCTIHNSGMTARTGVSRWRAY